MTKTISVEFSQPMVDALQDVVRETMGGKDLAMLEKCWMVQANLLQAVKAHNARNAREAEDASKAEESSKAEADEAANTVTYMALVGVPEARSDLQIHNELGEAG